MSEHSLVFNLVISAPSSPFSSRVLFVEGIHAGEPLLVEEVDHGSSTLVPSSQPKFTDEGRNLRYLGSNLCGKITDYHIDWFFSAFFAVIRSSYIFLYEAEVVLMLTGFGY